MNACEYENDVSTSDFSTITPYFFNPISKKFCNFSLELNVANRRNVLQVQKLIKDILNLFKFFMSNVLVVIYL